MCEMKKCKHCNQELSIAEKYLNAMKKESFVVKNVLLNLEILEKMLIAKLVVKILNKKDQINLIVLKNVNYKEKKKINMKTYYVRFVVKNLKD